ncbi:NAD(P)H-binding protein [Amycolatopsis sp. FDAARGOS 1241]|uniref:NAD(P)H-binding protein n=1 Tax=Amycolatopsis sp. FDAARGOS 1241 TaxID=2778070 RepID=UPI001951DCEA|nr:NAD(P)H-binding protein [Amycolatopsis sp. FDAARGOS 1241]QRP48768.1 NAD(P)H-binding protein [Amycolatopsis sp. FDAARGOS 1241]
MTVLVTGATGNVGRLVVDELLARGVPVRALTKDPARAKLPDGVDVVVGSLARPATLPAALAGIEQVYLAPMARTVARFCELAADAGVRRVVALSGSSVGDETAGSSGPEFAAVEAAVQQAGFERTFLRPGVFMMNSLGWAHSVRTHGEIRSAHAKATQTPIDLADIAAVAAHVFTTDGHSGRTYVLSGPEALTLEEMAATIARALGKDVPFVELTRGQQHAEWVDLGMPAEIAGWLLDGFAAAEADPQEPTGVTEELLGRRGVTYAEWAAAHTRAFS